MGTRASLAVVWTGPNGPMWSDPVWMYRHGDGEPEGVEGDIRALQGLAADGTLSARRDEVAAWLVLIGAGAYGRALHREKPWRETVRETRGRDEEAEMEPERRMGVLSSVWVPFTGIAGDASWLHVLHAEQRKPQDVDAVTWAAWAVAGDAEDDDWPEAEGLWQRIVGEGLRPDYRNGKRTAEGEQRIGWMDEWND